MRNYIYFVVYYWVRIDNSYGVGNVEVESPEIDSFEKIRDIEETIKESDKTFENIVLLNFVKLREVEEDGHDRQD